MSGVNTDNNVSVEPPATNVTVSNIENVDIDSKQEVSKKKNTIVELRAKAVNDFNPENKNNIKHLNDVLDRINGKGADAGILPLIASAVGAKRLDVVGKKIEIEPVILDFDDEVDVEPVADAVENDVPALLTSGWNPVRGRQFRTQPSDRCDGDHDVKSTMTYQLVVDATGSAYAGKIRKEREVELKYPLFRNRQENEQVTVITTGGGRHKYESHRMSGAWSGAQGKDEAELEKSNIYTELAMSFTDERDAMKRNLGVMKQRFFGRLDDESHLLVLVNSWLHVINLHESEQLTDFDAMPRGDVRDRNFISLGGNMVQYMQEFAGLEPLNLTMHTMPGQALAFYKVASYRHTTPYEGMVGNEAKRTYSANIVTPIVNYKGVLASTMNGETVLNSAAEAARIVCDVSRYLEVHYNYVAAMGLGRTNLVAREVAVQLSSMNRLARGRHESLETLLPLPCHVRDMFPMCVAEIGLSDFGPTRTKDDAQNMIFGGMLMQEVVRSSAVQIMGEFDLVYDEEVCDIELRTEDMLEKYRQYTGEGTSSEDLKLRSVVKKMFSLDVVSLQIVRFTTNMLVSDFAGEIINTTDILTCAYLQTKAYTNMGNAMLSAGAFPNYNEGYERYRSPANDYMCVLSQFGMLDDCNPNVHTLASINAYREARSQVKGSLGRAQQCWGKPYHVVVTQYAIGLSRETVRKTGAMDRFRKWPRNVRRKRTDSPIPQMVVRSQRSAQVNIPMAETKAPMISEDTLERFHATEPRGAKSDVQLSKKALTSSSAVKLTGGTEWHKASEQAPEKQLRRYKSRSELEAEWAETKRVAAMYEEYLPGVEVASISADTLIASATSTALKLSEYRGKGIRLDLANEDLRSPNIKMKIWRANVYRKTHNIYNNASPSRDLELGKIPVIVGGPFKNSYDFITKKYLGDASENWTIIRVAEHMKKILKNLEIIDAYKGWGEARMMCKDGSLIEMFDRNGPMTAEHKSELLIKWADEAKKGTITDAKTFSDRMGLSYEVQGNRVIFQKIKK